MIPEWLRVPSLEEWQRKADHPDFHDRNVGLKDAVQAGWYQSRPASSFVASCYRRRCRGRCWLRGGRRQSFCARYGAGGVL